MCIEEFAEKVKQRVSEEVQEEVFVGTVTKNNGVILHSLMIQRAEKSLHPTIYLEDFYKEYVAGKGLDEIIREIIVCEKRAGVENTQHDIMSWFCDFEKVKDSIVYRLVNTGKNKGLLKEVPHQSFLDLSKVYYVEVDMGEIKQGSIRICNNHLDMWGVTEEEIMKVAEENIRKYKVAHTKKLGDILMELMRSGRWGNVQEFEDEKIWKENIDKGPEMYVATNDQCLHGANVMCYENFLRDFAEEKRSDIYILPSSIHELILLPVNKCNGIEVEELRNMVNEVNMMQVPEEEILSNNVYYYDRVEDRVTVINK